MADIYGNLPSGIGSFARGIFGNLSGFGARQGPAETGPAPSTMIQRSTTPDSTAPPSTGLSALTNVFNNLPSGVGNFAKGIFGSPMGTNVVNAFGSSMTPGQENFLAGQHAAQAANGLSQPYDVWRQQTGIPTFMGAHLQIPGELHPTIYTPQQLQLIGAVNNAIA